MRLEINVELVNALIGYLRGKPMSETEGLVNALRSLREIKVEKIEDNKDETVK